MRTFRIANFVFATSALFWVPCAVLSVAFFYADGHYLFALRGPPEDTSLSADYRALADTLQHAEGFQCHTPSHRVISAGDEFDPRDLVLVAIERSMSAVRNRGVVLDTTPYMHVIYWVDDLDLGLLRRGREVRARYGDGSTPFSYLDIEKIRPYCERQDLQRLREEPLLPPIDLASEVRADLLRAADRMDEAVAAYAEVRPWLLTFFYAWIAYSAVGLLCAFYILRLTQPYADAVRAARDADDLPPW